MKYLFLLFSFSFYGQVLHHQMLSSQGDTKVLSNGVVVRQTIGQQSVIGNSDGDIVVMQGFQQSLWSKYISSNTTEYIKTIVYPNPFIDKVNFEFSKPIQEIITVSVYDILGRLVFEQKKKPDEMILTIDLFQLPRSEYLVRLYSTNYNYYTKIIRQ
jgi:hypothetical protein